MEVAIMPVVLGGGMPFVGPDAPPSRLALTGSSISARGIVNLRYDVLPEAE
jgi:hypothetical protein